MYTHTQKTISIVEKKCASLEYWEGAFCEIDLPLAPIGRIVQCNLNAFNWNAVAIAVTSIGTHAFASPLSCFNCRPSANNAFDLNAMMIFDNCTLFHRTHRVGKTFIKRNIVIMLSLTSIIATKLAQSIWTLKRLLVCFFFFASFPMFLIFRGHNCQVYNIKTTFHSNKNQGTCAFSSAFYLSSLSGFPLLCYLLFGLLINKYPSGHLNVAIEVREKHIDTKRWYFIWWDQTRTGVRIESENSQQMRSSAMERRSIVVIWRRITHFPAQPFSLHACTCVPVSKQNENKQRTYQRKIGGDHWLNRWLHNWIFFYSVWLEHIVRFIGMRHRFATNNRSGWSVCNRKTTQ